MRLITILLVVLVLCAVSSEAWLFKENEYVKLFQSFIARFKRAYSTSAFSKKLLQFKKNLDLITNVNKIKRKYTLGVNEFADLTAAEFRSKYLGARPVKRSSLIEEHAVEGLSEEARHELFAVSTDHRSRLGQPQHQQDCGGCWAFTVAATIEAARAIQSGSRSVSVSTQRMIDCACSGCSGGTSICGFDNAKVGYYQSTDFPYKNKQGACTTSSVTALGKIASYTYVAGSASAYATALKTNPLWLTINADKIQFYKGGIVDATSNCTNAVNHAVTLVGVQVASGSQVYVIRNSWGPDWGEAGHFRLDSAGDVCGVHSYGAYYPVLPKK